MEQLNGNLDWQFFCDIYLGAARLDNFKMISEIRCELASKLDMDRVQEAFYGHWSPNMRDKGCITMDATCYESHLRYPTNIKLLWEAVDWLHGLIKDICKTTGETLPRSRYLKWKKRYVSYSKMRRKTKKKRRALTRALLLLLDKLGGEVDRLEARHKITMTGDQYRRRATAKKVLAQQHNYFHKGERPKDRIVSMDRPYIRPIVRGKETKPVEFGAKVNPSEWPWPGGQIPGRRDQLCGTPELQCLPRGQPFPGYGLQGPKAYKDQNEAGRCRCHLCHQQEPQLRHQIRYQDRLQEKGQGRQARETEEQVGRRHHQGAGQQAGGQLRKGQGALPPEKDKGTDQGHRGPMDILRNPYGQRSGDR